MVMKKHSFGQQLKLLIFLVGCILQSCSKPINPVVPNAEKKTELPLQPVPPRYIQPLLDQTLTAQGGHIVNFYEEDGQLVADIVINTLKGFSKNYQRVEVFIEQGASLSSLVQANNIVQQQLISFRIAQSEKRAHIIIYNKVGMMGGGKRGKNKRKKGMKTIQQNIRGRNKERKLKHIPKEEEEPIEENKGRALQQILSESQISLEQNTAANLSATDEPALYKDRHLKVALEDKHSQREIQYTNASLSQNGQGNGRAYANRMPVIAGYQLLNCLHEGTLSNIYRAIRLSDKLPVVIKVSARKAMTDKKLQSFRREFKLGQHVHSPYVIRHLKLQQDTSYGIALIMEDDQLVELNSIIPPKGFSNSEFIKIAIQIVRGLQAIHNANIIHRDIKLSNILIHPTTKTIKIIDFNGATTLREERKPTISTMAGTLAYISPEQTGRVNRNVDHRTDFYALGVTFYQMLCGQLPFRADDTLKLIHQHLAKQPLSPCECKPTIALPLSQLVMKLLEKEPENRYQSCEGILHDLSTCLSAINQTGIIPSFRLGEQDFSNKLTLSQHVYGREKEMDVLLSAFKRASEGRCEAVMITGQPGVGKTMLIQEIQKPIALKQAYFITGKFDQLNKSVAYSALTQAFNGLVQQWLSEGQNSIEKWKNELLTALGPQISSLVKVIPSLSQLNNNLTEPCLTDISQAKNVFNWLFYQFVKVCATVSHPLVIFLDDLQWADQASLDLMTYLLQQPNMSHLLWIGAYRDTDITSLHPTLQSVIDLQKASIYVQTLKLTPLSLESLCQWIADSLHKPLINVQPLAELIHKKTEGSPFFVKLFLQSIYDQQLLTFSPYNHWEWKLNKIRYHSATENVVSLMTCQLKQLSPITQKALTMASCLGHCLRVSTLQTAMDTSQNLIFDALQPAFNNGILIQKEDDIYFAHDRVQEAAYHLLSASKKNRTHLIIGRRLLARLSNEANELFDIATQFNHCLSLVTKFEERLQIAHLNIKASQKAKQATAYEAALTYLYNGQKWVDIKSLWETNYPLAFTFHKELAEVEYLTGHMDTSQALIAYMQPYLKSNLDKIDIYHLLVIQKTLQGQIQATITIVQQALQLLGSQLPLDNPTEFIEYEMPLVSQELANRSFSSLLDASLINDPEKQALFKILGVIYSASYLAGTDLYLATALIAIKLGLAYGHAPESCISYAVYGLMLCSKYDQYTLGYQFGNLAIKLAEKLQSPVQRCQASLIMTNFIYHWSKPLHQLPDLLNSVYEACLTYAELEFGGYCGQAKVQIPFYLGIPLNTVQQVALPLLQFAYNTKNQVAINAIQAVQRLLANLKGDTVDIENFDIGTVDENKFQENCRRANSFYSLCLYHIIKAQALYLYSHFDRAIEQLNLAKPLLVYVMSNYVSALFNWYHSLTCLALYPSASKREQVAYLKQVTTNQQQMKKWQDSCPENFAHKYWLVEAEWAKVQGNCEQAEQYYDQAIRLVGQHKFIQEKALIAELAAQYWLATRNRTICSQGYIISAFNGYKQWGSKRKLDLFKIQYESLLKDAIPATLSHLAINQETTLSSNTLRFLDLSSILKASQTISSEIELPKLLRSMMQLIIENAGAQKGALLFVEPDETLVVHAEYTADGTITTLQKIPLQKWSHGAHTVIEHVKRIKQPLVIDDATKHEQFEHDPYINQIQAKSILCIPLLKHTELRAILYLENNLMSYAFTPERVQTVLVLTTQMAISLENARYVAEQINLHHQLTEQSTRRQIAEQSLHAVTHDLKLALEASQAGTWNWVISTNQLTWDTTNCALFGLKPEEFKGTYEALFELVHPDDRERLRQDIQQCLDQDTAHNLEYRIIWPDSSEHIIAAHGHVYRDMISSKPIKMTGVCLDITHRKRLEQERLVALQQAEEKERQRADEAERYFKQQQEFVNTVCHEVRNPMNGISNTLTFMEEKLSTLKSYKESLPANLQPEIEETVQSLGEEIKTINQCVDHQLAVINAVLNLSRLKSGKEELVIVPFNLKKIIEETVSLFKSQLQYKQLDLIIDLPKQAIGIKGDAERFKRVLINLISNAIKFTQRGYVKLSVQTQLIDSGHIALAIRVEDTGIGMADDDQANLFEQFTRPRSSQYEGSGLGLAISKKLIDLMGGTIQVESTKGKGTTFTIYLTCETVDIKTTVNLLSEQKPSAPSPPISRFSSNHILVAEDNQVNQKVLCRQLKAAGYNYTIADNGQKAIEAIGATEEVNTPEKWNPLQFSLILMDISMPIMDGLQATERIRKKEKQLGINPIPIIGVSAYTEETYSGQAKQAGMDAYTTKPYIKAELLRLIQELLLCTLSEASYSKER
jgi:PAS domain S-box-containing protein